MRATAEDHQRIDLKFCPAKVVNSHRQRYCVFKATQAVKLLAMKNNGHNGELSMRAQSWIADNIGKLHRGFKGSKYAQVKTNKEDLIQRLRAELCCKDGGVEWAESDRAVRAEKLALQ